MRILRFGGERIALVRALPGLQGAEGRSSNFSTIGAVTLPATGTVNITINPALEDGDTVYGQILGITCLLSRSGATTTIRRFTAAQSTTSLPSGSVFRAIAYSFEVFPLASNATIPVGLGGVTLTLDLPAALLPPVGSVFQVVFKGVTGTLTRLAGAGQFSFVPTTSLAVAVPLSAAVDFGLLASASPLSNPIRLAGTEYRVEGIPGAAFAVVDATAGIVRRALFYVDRFCRMVVASLQIGQWRIEQNSADLRFTNLSGVDIASFVPNGGKPAFRLGGSLRVYDDPALPDGLIRVLSSDNRQIAIFDPARGWRQIPPYGQATPALQSAATANFAYQTSLDSAGRRQIFAFNSLTGVRDQITFTGDNFDLSAADGIERVCYTKEHLGVQAAYWANPTTRQESLLVSSTDIIGFSDSMGNSSDSYIQELRNVLPQRAIQTEFQGGQIVRGIAARAGGVPVLLSGVPGNTIQTTLTAVTLSVLLFGGGPGSFMSMEGTVNSSNRCLLVYDGTAAAFTIRSLTGGTISCPPNSVFTPTSTLSFDNVGVSCQPIHNFKQRTWLFWGGRNDTGQWAAPFDTAQIVADIQAAIATSPCRTTRYLVLGVLNGFGDVEVGQGGSTPGLTGAQSEIRLSRTPALNTALAAAFGNRFVDMYAHFASQPGATTPITPTGSSNTYQVLVGTSSSQPAGALIGDGIHLNAAGKLLAANFVKTQLEARGW